MKFMRHKHYSSKHSEKNPWRNMEHVFVVYVRTRKNWDWLNKNTTRKSNPFVTKYGKKIAPTKIKPAMIKWFEETFEAGTYHISQSQSHLNFKFFFKNKEDAILFKLTWR